MRRFVLSAVLLLSTLLICIPQASAQEVYAVTEKNGGKVNDYYVVTESIKNTGQAFGLTIHVVGKNHSYDNYSNWFYAYMNGAWHFVPGGNLAVAMRIDSIEDPMFKSVIYGVFKTARQYM